MNVVAEYHRAQKALLPDDEKEIAGSAGAYSARFHFTSGRVANILDRTESMGQYETNTSGVYDSFKNTTGTTHSQYRRVTELALIKSDGEEETLTMYSARHENALPDISKGEAVTVGYWNETLGKVESKPQVMLAYQHGSGSTLEALPPQRPVLLAPSRLLSTLWRHVFIRPLWLLFFGWLIMVISLFIKRPDNLLTNLWERYLAYLTPAYRELQDVAIQLRLCDIVNCHPNASVGNWTGAFSVLLLLMLLGVLTGIVTAIYTKWQNVSRNRCFNDTLDTVAADISQRLTHYRRATEAYQESAAAHMPATDQSLERGNERTGQDTPRPVAPDQPGTWQRPLGEWFYSSRVGQKRLYFKDVVKRIEGFKRKSSGREVIVTGRIHHRYASTEEFTHTQHYSYDAPEYACRLYGLNAQGKTDSTRLPEGFGTGPVTQGDLLTLTTLEFKRFGKIIPYGAVALVNESQGWKVTTESLQPVMQTLIPGVTSYGAGFSIMGLVSFTIAGVGINLNNMHVAWAGAGGFALMLVGALWIMFRVASRRRTLAQHIERQIEALGT